MAIGIVWSKVVALSTMFVVTMVIGTIVFLIVRFFKRKGKNTANLGESTMVRLLNCFAGGLFLGTFLLGLLPEVRHLFEGILERFHSDTHFPVAEGTTAVGFFLVMSLEHLVMFCQTRGSRDTHGIGHSHGHAPPRGGNPKPENGHLNQRGNELGVKNSSFGSFHYEHGKGDAQSLDGGRVGVERPSQLYLNDLNFKLGERNLVYDNNRESEQVSGKPAYTVPCTGGEDVTPGRSQKSENMVLGSRLESLGDPRTTDFGAEETPRDTKKSSLRAFMLVLALSLHTLFEGLALGLLDSESVIWTLLIAVSVHKAVIVTGLAIELSKEDTNTVKRIFLSLFVFAIMSPIGVGLGTAVTETGAPDDLATDTAAGIMQGLAAGTFLYVTFFEVLNRELESGHDLRKVLAIMVGFSAIIGLRFLEHSSGH